MMFELARARKVSGASTSKKSSTASHDNHENLIRGFPLLSYMGIGLRPRSPFEPRELRFKVAPQNLFNPQKSCIVSCLSRSDNNKWGTPSLFQRYKSLKLNLRVFLAGYIVIMANCYIIQMTAPLPMIRHFYDTIFVASLVKQ